MQADFLTAINKSIDWLTSRQCSNGSFGDNVVDIIAYYKAPFAFIITGKIEQAHKILDYIKLELMKKNGDFRSNDGKSFDEYMINYPVYPNGWIILAAHLLGRFDISFKGLKYVLSFYNPRWGGFCTKEPYRKRNNTVDVITTAHLGLVSLYIGHVEKAELAGNLLVNFIDIQPNKDTFFLRIDGNQEIISKFSKEKEKFFVINSSHHAQDYFHLGYAIGFLSKLYLATGSLKYLEFAKKYANFLLKCQQDIYQFPKNRKVGWGFSTLFSLTNDSRYQAVALKMLEDIINHQKESGEWIYGADMSDFSDPICLTYTLDLVSETTIWLNEMIRILV